MLAFLTHPVVLIASGAAWLLFGRKRAATLEPDEFLITLDQGLSDADSTRVLQLLLYSTNCAELDASANQLASLGYPLCAQELRSRSAQVRAAMPQKPSPCQYIDPNLDPQTCQSVLNALTTSKSPADLSAFAASIAAKYPQAAAALNAQAAALQAKIQAAPAAPAATAPASPAASDGTAVSPAHIEEGALGALAADILAAGKFPGQVPVPLGNDIHVVPEQEQTGAGKFPGAVPVPLGNDIHVIPEQEQTGGTAPQPAYVLIRPVDKIKPPNLAKIGAGGKSVSAELELVAHNPELRGPDGMIREFHAGQKIKVPAAWAGRLRERGFEVNT